jgi:hypothetical protein
MKRPAIFFVALVLSPSPAAIGQVIYNNASTAGEGYARGVGNVIQAQGQRNLSNSQAAINLTDARSAQIDNQLKSVNAFWEKQSIYAQHQQQEFAQIEQKRALELSLHGLGTLTPQEFDRTTGTVTWPKVLEQKQYDQFRNVLDTLMKKRAYQGFLSSDEYMQATTASKDWRAMLASQSNVYPAPILSQMIRFILKIDRERDENLG